MLLLAAAETVGAQVAPGASLTVKVPVYDVVSIKLNNGGTGQTGIRSNDGNFSATNVSLKLLVSIAYLLQQDQILALPAWAESARFDIEAKVIDPDKAVFDGLTDKQRTSMLQPILAQRFGLTSHTESRVLPAFELVVVKGGPKFKESTLPGVRSGMSTQNREMTATAVSPTSLTAYLSSALQRVVIDRTGLTARYDLALKWSRDDAPPDDTAPPTLPTALQEQLGLKLVSTKAPVPTLVIDHVEMPSEN